MNGLYQFQGEAFNGSNQMYLYISNNTFIWYDAETESIQKDNCKVKYDQDDFYIVSHGDSIPLTIHSPSNMSCSIDNGIDDELPLTKWINPFKSISLSKKLLP